MSTDRDRPRGFPSSSACPGLLFSTTNSRSGAASPPPPTGRPGTWVALAEATGVEERNGPGSIARGQQPGEGAEGRRTSDRVRIRSGVAHGGRMTASTSTTIDLGPRRRRIRLGTAAVVGVVSLLAGALPAVVSVRPAGADP